MVCRKSIEIVVCKIFNANEKIHCSITNVFPIIFANLGQFGCTESQNHIGFPQSDQISELWPDVNFYVFTSIDMSIKISPYATYFT